MAEQISLCSDVTESPYFIADGREMEVLFFKFTAFPNLAGPEN